MRTIKKIIAAREQYLILKMLTDYFAGKTVQVWSKIENSEKNDDKEGVCKRIRTLRDNHYYFEIELEDLSCYKILAKDDTLNKFDNKSWTFIVHNKIIKILMDQNLVQEPMKLVG